MAVKTPHDHNQLVLSPHVAPPTETRVCALDGCDEPLKRKQKKYCSRDCLGKSQRGTRVIQSVCALAGCERRTKTSRQKYCGRACSSKSQRRNVELECLSPSCTKVIPVRPYAVNKKGQKYCSRECFYKAQSKYPRVERTCKGCGITFFVSQRIVERGGGVYCKRECLLRPIGATWRTPQGYVFEKTPNGWQLQHRLVWERKLGRELDPSWVVHHRNGVRDDNREENLALCRYSQPPGQLIEDRVPYMIDELTTLGYEISGGHQAILELL